MYKNVQLFLRVDDFWPKPQLQRLIPLRTHSQKKLFFRNNRGKVFWQRDLRIMSQICLKSEMVHNLEQKWIFLPVSQKNMIQYKPTYLYIYHNAYINKTQAYIERYSLAGYWSHQSHYVTVTIQSHHRGVLLVSGQTY